MVRHCAEEFVCMCVCRRQAFLSFHFSKRMLCCGIVQNHISLLQVCVCVLHRVAFKDSFAALKGIPRVEFKDSVAASVFMFRQRYVCRTGWKHGLFATSFARSYVVSRVCNDEMISHILEKLIMGRDLQCELSFSAAHAMTKYEV